MLSTFSHQDGYETKINVRQLQTYRFALGWNCMETPS